MYSPRDGPVQVSPIESSRVGIVDNRKKVENHNARKDGLPAVLPVCTLLPALTTLGATLSPHAICVAAVAMGIVILRLPAAGGRKVRQRLKAAASCSKQVCGGGLSCCEHGGHDGTRKLRKGDLILIDVGAHLYGYSSDICRTFYPPFFSNPPPAEYNITEQMNVWQIVLDAQAASVKAMVPNGTAASVDIAAREVIEKAGYGEAFTHRLGHGIGIKAHESPYLNKGNLHLEQSC